MQKSVSSLKGGRMVRINISNTYKEYAKEVYELQRECCELDPDTEEPPAFKDLVVLLAEYGIEVALEEWTGHLEDLKRGS